MHWSNITLLPGVAYAEPDACVLLIDYCPKPNATLLVRSATTTPLKLLLLVAVGL